MIVVMNIKIKSHSTPFSGQWKTADNFLYILPVEKINNAISHFAEGVNKNVILHL